MWVLHLLSNDRGLEQIRGIVEQKNGLYLQTTLKQYQDMIDAFEEFNLLIIETETDVEAFERLITDLTEASNRGIPIIVISDSLDYKVPPHLFDRGVMTIMSRSQFDEKRFVSYIDTLISEKQTIEALKEMNIAVVDDSNFSLEIIKGYFSRMGVDRVVYYQNSEALMAGPLNYDLFLVDFLMPVYNGEDLIYKIRQVNTEAIIILITAYGDGKTVPHCLSIGANDFLIKPLNYKLFTLRINAVVNQYRLNQENKKNHALLYQLATKDSLTGVYNRAFFIESLKNKALEFKRSRQPLSLILLDLDHFKNVNDEYGHQTGDEVLKGTAELLVAHTRDTDIVCRWGGEEFCVILADAELNDAVRIAEKMRVGISEMYFPGVRQITASFGVTSWQFTDTEDSLFKRLDNSLYLAKLTGRNKVVCNEELVISDLQHPVAVEWGPFFRSGNTSIDLEHQRLITISNEIIANCFETDNQSRTVYLFSKLIEDTVDHFKHEEEILAVIGYDKLMEHKRIHKDLVKKTLSMHEKLINGSLSAVQVAKYVIQEVIIGHIIKSDFEYYELLSSRQL